MLSSVFHEVDILFKEKVAEDLRSIMRKGHQSARGQQAIRYSSLI